MNVAVLVAARNAEEFVVEAVNSLLTQDFRDLAIIVVDDNSTDSTAERIDAIKDSRVIYHRLPVHCGIATARNFAMRLASKTDYVAVMDADDIAHPERISEQVRYLEDHRDVHILGSRIHIFRGKGKNIVMKPNHPVDDDVIKGRLLLLNGSALIHPTTMMRTSFLQDNFLEYPPPLRGHIGIDHDFWISAIPAGVRFAALPRVLLLKRRHDANVSSGSTMGGEMAERKTRSRVRLLTQYYPDLTANEVFRIARLLEERRVIDGREFTRALETCRKAFTITRSQFGESKQLLRKIFEARLRHHANALQHAETQNP